MNMKQLKFDIGDWVEFSVVRVRCRVWETPERRVWESEKKSKPMHGRVVGLARKVDGVYHSATCYDSGYLEPTNSHVFYQVKLGWLNKPLLVAEEDMVLYQPETRPTFPLMPVAYYWSEDDKAIQREEVATWPRDAKGRWMKP